VNSCRPKRTEPHASFETLGAIRRGARLTGDGDRAHVAGGHKVEQGPVLSVGEEIAHTSRLLEDHVLHPSSLLVHYLEARILERVDELLSDGLLLLLPSGWRLHVDNTGLKVKKSVGEQ
jgi:hypothetical protein